MIRPWLKFYRCLRHRDHKSKARSYITSNNSLTCLCIDTSHSFPLLSIVNLASKPRMASDWWLNRHLGSALLLSSSQIASYTSMIEKKSGVRRQRTLLVSWKVFFKFRLLARLSCDSSRCHRLKLNAATETIWSADWILDPWVLPQTVKESSTLLRSSRTFATQCKI